MTDLLAALRQATMQPAAEPRVSVPSNASRSRCYPLPI